MTDTAGPFDGTPWAEAQWSRHAAQWAPSAVYGSPAASTTTGDLPLSVSALTVGLGAGRAWVRGFGFERTGAVMQAVTANTHASFSRRDRIVLRRNLATHTVTPVLLTGTPAGGPTAPGLTQIDAGSWDLPMFSFLVPPNSGTSITGLVDERGWVNPSSSGVAFASTAARDANFPSPTEGLQCTVDGQLQVYSGGWQSLDNNNAGTSGVLAGSAPPAGTPLLAKAFTGGCPTNSNGDASLAMPGGAFPNGLVTAHLMINGNVPVFPVITPGTTTGQLSVRIYDSSGVPVGALPALQASMMAWGW